MKDDVFVERVRNKSTNKIRDPAGIRTQDLLNTRADTLTIKPLGPLAEEQKTSYISVLGSILAGSGFFTFLYFHLPLVPQADTLTLSHSDPWGAEDKLHKQHCLEANPSWISDFFSWIYFSLSQQKYHHS